jgi:FixJ family two-component response regulator
MPTIFIIDQNDGRSRSIAAALASEAANVRIFESAEDFLGEVALGAMGCVIAHEDLAGMGIRALLNAIRTRAVPLPVVVIGRDSDLAIAVELVRAGAVEYLEPPVSDRRLRSVIRNTIAAGENRTIRHGAS